MRLLAFFVNPFIRLINRLVCLRHGHVPRRMGNSFFAWAECWRCGKGLRERVDAGKGG
jgi:hypothetical protein